MYPPRISGLSHHVGRPARLRSAVVAHKPLDAKPSSVTGHLLALQASAGNRAVCQLLDASRGPGVVAAQRACCSSCAAGGGCQGEHGEEREVQRFEFQEHQDLGNTATGDGLVNVGGTDPKKRFLLTHGEVIGLSADFFKPDDSSPDGLFHLGETPGKGVGTQDEILCALKVSKTDEEERRTKERAQGGTPPEPQVGKSSLPSGYTCSAAVEKTVRARYRILAADNTPHFKAPRGRDPITGGIVGPKSSRESNAGLSYRKNHEKALSQAFGIGRKGGDFSQAMATEAAAQHFLTDSFSAGHLRTPAAQIRDFWRAKYPLFWYNLKHKIALDTASELNRQGALLTFILSVEFFYNKTVTSIEEVTKSYPEVSLGDLVTKMFHDYDNMVGLDIGGGRRVFGDHLLRLQRGDNVTAELAVEAIRAGNDDVSQAFALGQSGTTVAGEALFAAVRQATGATDARYRAETMMPDVASTERAQNWSAPNFETLWDQPMEVGGSYKVADMAAFEMKPGSELFKQLQDLEAEFKKSAELGLDPGEAYRKGFLIPMANDPLKGLLETIHWSPSQGDLHSTDRDDVALASAEELDKSGQLGGMTTPARVEYVRQLIDGAVFPDEENMVMRIFETAAAGERPEIYGRVEGHPWKGKFIRGLFVRDDDLVDALSNDRLDRLTKLINEGAGKSHEILPVPKTHVDPVFDKQGKEIPGAAAKRKAPTPPPDRGRPPKPEPPKPEPPKPELVCPGGPLPHPLLKVGANGDAVSEIQCKLTKAAVPLLPLKTDSLFGPRTKGGVAAFQHARALGLDGKVGKETWGALDAATASPPAAHRVLGKGSSGPAVSELQEKLNTVGTQPTPLDQTGSFTVLEEGAVVGLQDREGLGVDGVAGDKTWRRVDELAGSTP